MSIASRLPKALQDQPVWVELMECFEELIQPVMDRVEKLELSNGMFTADDLNLDLIIEESGQIFDVEWNSPENKPLAVLRRKDELKFKTTVIPIEAMLDRAFIGLDSYWDQYYCKKTDIYLAANLTTKDSIEALGGNINDYFLTSRGFLRIDTATMLDRNISQEDVIGVIGGQLANIIPLHIVFDGIRFILSASINDLSINAKAESQLKKVSLPVDITFNSSASEMVTILPIAVEKMNVYAEDEMLNFDDVSFDFWPLDLPLVSNNGLITVDYAVSSPIPIGQLGDGQVPPTTEKQLGDGSIAASDSIQLSET